VKIDICQLNIKFLHNRQAKLLFSQGRTGYLQADVQQAKILLKLLIIAKTHCTGNENTKN
jgi:hypothetical protein